MIILKVLSHAYRPVHGPKKPNKPFVLMDLVCNVVSVGKVLLGLMALSNSLKLGIGDVMAIR